MASVLFPKYGEGLLDGSAGVDHLTDTIKILFYDGVYSAAFEFVSDLVSGDIIARSGALAGKTVTDGIFDANDITLTAVSGAAFGHVLSFKDTGSDATSRLTAIFDVSTFTPTGGDVTAVWNPSGIYKVAG